MYIKSFRIRNIACFEDLWLDFTNGNGKPCQWVVLLGENGTGKSTILQMVGLSLIGQDMIHRVSDYEWSDFIRRGQTEGRIEIILERTKSDRPKSNSRTDATTKKEYRAGFDLSTLKHSLKQNETTGFIEDYDFLDEHLYSKDLTVGWFACGYGPWRKISRFKSSITSGEVLRSSREKPERFATLFNTGVSLTVVSDWLIDLDYQRLKEKGNPTFQRTFDLAVETLGRVLRGIKFKEITSDREILFTQDGRDVALHQLSDGYRSTVAWIGDLVRRMVDAFPKMRNPLDAEGIVLIDELDIHLHPKWQAEVVEEVRQIFPNLQFIVSSHSPFVAQDVSENDKIVILKNTDGHIVADEQIANISGWRVDQILTSSLFDLETTRNLTIRLREREYQQLLDARSQGAISDIDDKRMSELKQWLDANMSGPGETMDENRTYEAAKSFARMLDSMLKR